MTDQRLTRPIMGLENRTPQEVFDIMCDRIFYAQTATDMATPADIAAAARRMDAYAAQEAKPDGNAQSEAVAWTTPSMLDAKREPEIICGFIWSRQTKDATVPLYPAPQSEAVAVKALEWASFWPENPEMAGRECAQTAFGTVYHVSNEGWWFAMRELDKHASIEAAKAAAQADYGQRIRSALTHPAPPLAVTDEMVERAVMNQERKRARLPALGSELLEFYPAMSAQTHEHAVKDYARNAIQASAKQVDEAMIGRAYQAAYDALLGTSADIGVGELDRLVRAALTAALEAKQ